MNKIVFKQEVIIPETGEIKEAVAIIPEIKDRNYVKVFQLFSRKLLEDMGYINGEAKLLMWFLAKTIELPIQSDMWIPVNYKELSKEINISERSIKKYIKKLIELGYIEQFKPRNTTFRIKPDFVYKGILKKYMEDKISELIK